MVFNRKRKTNKQIISEIKEKKEVLKEKLDRENLESELKTIKQKNFRTTKRFKIANSIAGGIEKAGKNVVANQKKQAKRKPKKRNDDIFGDFF